MPAARYLSIAQLRELARALDLATDALRTAAADNGDERQHAVERGIQALATIRTLLSLTEGTDMIAFGNLRPQASGTGDTPPRQYVSLPPSARQVLEALEARTDRVRHRDLAALVALPPGELRAALAALHRSRLVEIWCTETGLEYASH